MVATAIAVLFGGTGDLFRAKPPKCDPNHRDLSPFCPACSTLASNVSIDDARTRKFTGALPTKRPRNTLCAFVDYMFPSWQDQPS